MNAHVLLNLLDELGKTIRYLIGFPNEFNKFNKLNTGHKCKILFII